MAVDTVNQIIDEVASLTGADTSIARLWVRDAARRTFEQRHWSWLFRRANFAIPAAVTSASTSATCTVTEGDTLVTFTSAVVTESMVGRQFRPTDASPVYDIGEYVSGSAFRLSLPWQGESASGLGFTINLTRLPLPGDCLRLVAAVNPSQRWLLHTDIAQERLDWWDGMRSRSTNTGPSLLSSMGYSQIGSGKVRPAQRIIGSGNRPTAGGEYTGNTTAVYTVQMTSTGLGGVATFQWRKNELTWTAATSDTGTGNQLSEGVTVLWDSATSYTNGDTFSIIVVPQSNPGVMRVELYPSVSSRMVIPYYYIARQPDLTDPGVQLPGLLASRGDIIREKALEMAAATPNPAAVDGARYDQISRRDYHAGNWKALVEELGRQDNELMQRNVQQQLPAMPWAPLPWGPYHDPQTYDDPMSYPVW